jgi:hypothetical protein
LSPLTNQRLLYILQQKAGEWWYVKQNQGPEAEQTFLSEAIDYARARILGNARAQQRFAHPDETIKSGGAAFSDEEYSRMDEDTIESLRSASIHERSQAGGSTGVFDFDSAAFTQDLEGRSAVLATEKDGAMHADRLRSVGRLARAHREKLYPWEGRWLFIYGKAWQGDGLMTPLITRVSASGLVEVVDSYGSDAPTADNRFRDSLESRSDSLTQVNKPLDRLQEGRRFETVTVEGQVSESDIDPEDPDTFLNLIGKSAVIPVNQNPLLTQRLVQAIDPTAFNRTPYANPRATGEQEGKFAWTLVPSTFIRMSQPLDEPMRFDHGHAVPRTKDDVSLWIVRRQPDEPGIRL